MRFKIDENLHPEVAAAFRARGHDALTVRDHLLDLLWNRHRRWDNSGSSLKSASASVNKHRKTWHESQRGRHRR